MHLKYRQTCRVCGNPNLVHVIDLGEQYLQSAFIHPNRPTPSFRKSPLKIVRCDPSKYEDACGLVQLAHSVPPEILYSSYWYRSGITSTMRNHLKSIVASIESLINVEKKIVLDIGGNDGTLLSFYSKPCGRISIDPSDIASETKITKIKVINDFFPSLELNKYLGDEKVTVITAVAMFYDLEDPIDFISHIKRILSKDGVLVLEMAYLPLILERNTFVTFVNEHLEIYSLSVLEYILRQSGLKVFRAELNDSNDGSIRVFSTHIDNYKYDSVENKKHLRLLRQREFDLSLDTDSPYKEFEHRILLYKKELYNLLAKIKQGGGRIHVLGASTKMNTLLQFCDIDTRIVDCAAERSPEKIGARTIGTNIPIISEEESRAINPTHYLVGPYHFKLELLKRERQFIDNGGKLIFPLPFIEIVDKYNVDAVSKS